jgi:hypothetical protein
MPKITMVEAIAMAHGWEMQHDANVVVIGQDVGANGGVFRATAGLQERFGSDRVQDTPLAESTIADAWAQARRGDSVHGVLVSRAGSNREPHVAHAKPYPRPFELSRRHADAARRRHSRPRAPFGEH